MPITIKADASHLLSYLEIPDEIVQKLLATHVVKLDTDAFRILDKETKTVVGQLNMSTGMASLFAKGVLNAANKKIVKQHMLKIIAGLDGQPVATSQDDMVGIFPIAEMKTAPLVKLRDAKMLYQPVRGTSPSSRYFCVALNDDVKVGARWGSPATLSIRVEGDGLQAIKSNLVALGLTGSSSEHYSMHLQCGDNLTGRKALGAVLAGINTKFTSPMPEVKHVVT